VRLNPKLMDLETLVVAERPLRKVVVVMPAYNAEGTLERTFRDIPRDCVDEIVLVDDVSRDRTVDLARSLGLTTVKHEANRGYGGNQKTCYREALARGADIVILLHPDYQYDARVIPAMVHFLRLGICDAVLGSRIRTRAEALSCGMPWWKYVANRLLTLTENLVMGVNMGDAHTGLRAYTREVLETIPFDRNSDDFVFDSQFLSQLVWFRFRIGDVPVPTRYFKQASSIDFRRSVRYGLLTLWAMITLTLQRLGLARFSIYEDARGSHPGP
jgi:glycosyltransferase involved in cell wall biosynthesis